MWANRLTLIPFMRRLARFSVFFLVSCVLLGSCIKPGRPVSIRLSANGAIRLPTTLASFNCFFVSISAPSFQSSNPAVPACAGLGRVSSLLTFDQITTGGATLRVPVASNVTVRVLGVVTGQSCASAGKIENLFVGAARPEIYEVGSTSATLQEGASITVQSSFSAAAADLAQCDSAGGTEGGSAGGLTLASINPAAGLHRGGLAVALTGTGFEAGATVTIGGVASVCGSPSARGTSLTCTTPDIAAQAADVVVTNPGGSSRELADGYDAFQMIFTLTDDGGTNYIKAYRQAPGGALALVDSEIMPTVVGSMVLHPDGKWLAASLMLADQIGVWQVDLATGALTAAAPITLPLGAGSIEIAFHPNGGILYANHNSLGDLSSCLFLPTTGACPPADTQPWVDPPQDLSVSADGFFVFARTFSGFRRFGVDGATGALGTVSSNLGSPYGNSDSSFFHPTKGALFIHNTISVELNQLSVDGNGDLTLPSPDSGGVSTGAVPSHSFTSSGLALYLLESNASPKIIRKYDLDPISGLIANFLNMNEFTLSSGESPSPAQMVVDGQAKYLFLLQSAASETVQVFLLDPLSGLPTSPIPTSDVSMRSRSVTGKSILVD